jgi:ABC-type multidrug transport system permease subunit
MYHAGIDAVSSLISIFPLKLVSPTIFSLILYFLSNLKREAGPFFTFLLFTYTTVLLMASLFRFVAAVSKHEATAVSVAGVLLLPLVVYIGCESSFSQQNRIFNHLLTSSDIIPTKSMHPWFHWISYINPLSYSFEALMVSLPLLSLDYCTC